MTASLVARTRAVKTVAATAGALVAIAALAVPAGAVTTSDALTHARGTSTLAAQITKDSRGVQTQSLCGYLGYPLPFLCPSPKDPKR